jgi:outer membrane protein OmpA-like peptidoglycan-associated protein
MDRRAAAAAFALLAFAAAPRPASACTVPIPIVLFETGSAALDDADRGILDRMVVALHQSEAGLGLRYSLFGHGDRAGTDDYNLALSRRRAEAVRDYLLDRGISAGAIERIESFGETRLMVDTADGVAHPQNRRVEILWYSTATGRRGC